MFENCRVRLVSVRGESRTGGKLNTIRKVALVLAVPVQMSCFGSNALADVGSDGSSPLTVNLRPPDGPAVVRTDPWKVATAYDELARLHADLEREGLTWVSDGARDCPSCVSGAEEGVEDEVEYWRGSYFYTYVYDKIRWQVDLNPLTLFGGRIRADGITYTAWMGTDPFNMDKIAVSSDMYFRFMTGSVTVSYPPGAEISTIELGGHGDTVSVNNAWRHTLTGNDERAGKAPIGFGHEGVGSHTFREETHAVRAVYHTGFDPNDE